MNAFASKATSAVIVGQSNFLFTVHLERQHRHFRLGAKLTNGKRFSIFSLVSVEEGASQVD